MNEKQQQLVSTLEIIRVEEFIPRFSGYVGRPLTERAPIARAFIAKAVYNMPTMRMLIERLRSDISLRRICGWESVYRIPDESVFSRAFAEFSTSGLPQAVHNALISKVYGCGARLKVPAAKSKNFPHIRQR